MLSHNVITFIFSLLKQVSCVYQVPSASVTVEGGCALNRVRWSSGGREVAVGDSEGRLWIYDVGEVITPTLSVHEHLYQTLIFG